MWVMYVCVCVAEGGYVGNVCVCVCVCVAEGGYVGNVCVCVCSRGWVCG